jgi:hypothetical protein
MTKIGILEFRYGNSKRFEQRLKSTGTYTINTGDWIQTLAVQTLLESIGVARADMVRIDRDTLPAYDGPAVRLVMNACFLDHCFPLPPQIQPVFVGFQTSSRELIRTHLDYFKRHQPIGCRDNETCGLFREQGVDAYTTGCLTMTLPLRETMPSSPKVFLVGGEKAGELPPSLQKHLPDDLRRTSTYVHQREPVTTFPLNDDEAIKAEQVAVKLLNTYREQATLVVTPLLHAAGPCVAMGIPVILARKDYRDRFTAISRVLPVYTPPTFDLINWAPHVPNVEALKNSLRSLLARVLAGQGPSADERGFLTEFYEKTPGPTAALQATHAARGGESVWWKIPFLRPLLRR